MLEDEMRRSYLDYAMSVIVSRALPDARDGLKPVHRRILFAMQEGGYVADKPYRKSARIVGDVMGKYHPHGDASIYDALVRMAQTFSMRVPLIDGQGNFGSVDGDPPAAMRYTESRLDRAANFLLHDIDKDTVDIVPSYDESGMEPRVLPASYPVLLINGANGIAVGMATNIPPHNPTEIIDATLALIAEPATTLEELMQIVPGPDFPTGGLILGRAGIRSAFEGGRGSVVVRAKAAIEEMKGNRQSIVITEIPYQVNKSTLIERIADLVRSKAVEGITDLRDESDRDGMRIVIELRREATAEVVLNQLYRFTQLQTSFGVNMLALDGGRPRLMGLKDALEVFIAFREDVILRRSRFELNKARERAHLLVGLAIAVANIDDMIQVIRESPDAATARAAMMGRSWPAGDVSALLALIDDSGNQIVDDTVRLTDAQARGILELRLARLTGLERDKIQAELVEVATRIGDLLEILDSRPRRDRQPAHDGHRRRRCGPRRREPDRAGPDGGHHHPRRLHQAHGAGNFPPAEPGRPWPYRSGHAGRRHRDPQLQRAYAPMGAVLQQGRQGVPREGLAPARGQPDRERPRAGEHAAGIGRGRDHDRAAAAAGRKSVGEPAPRVRHR